jgi:hypothetical protein
MLCFRFFFCLLILTVAMQSALYCLLFFSPPFHHLLCAGLFAQTQSQQGKMTTAQQSSHLNANLPNLKAQTHDPLSEPAAALLAKEEREQLVPAAPLDKADAPAGSPSQAEASLPASASDTPQRATGEAPMGPEEAEKLLATIPEITIEGTEVLVKVPADLVGRYAALVSIYLMLSRRLGWA